MLIRVLKPLMSGRRPGDGLFPASLWKPGMLATLLAVGAVSIATGPPLSQLPGWKLRTAILAKVGIETVEELIDADAAKLAALVGRSERAIEHWQQAALQALLPGRRDKG